jgi:hypothetical protein
MAERTVSGTILRKIMGLRLNTLIVEGVRIGSGAEYLGRRVVETRQTVEQEDPYHVRLGSRKKGTTYPWADIFFGNVPGIRVLKADHAALGKLGIS